ncbi:MAG: type II toxin-antitoxin system HicB family antitoxin [Patescibacteria group bacterium]
MVYKFTTIIQQDGKWFVARCVELGVVSQGKSVEQAQKNLKEAIGLYLQDSPKPKKEMFSQPPLVTTLELNYA